MYPRKKNAVHRHVRSIVGNDQDDDTDCGHASHAPQWMRLTDCLVLLYGCMNDSAGKFCPDKWTRKEEERRVEGKGDEELPHEDEKEDQDVTARPTARTHT